MENTGGLASYSEFNGHIGGFHSNGLIAYHSDTGAISKDLSPDAGSEESFSNSSSKSEHSCISAAFDEEFPVNGEEELKTPCASPTLDILRTMSTAVKPSPKPLGSHHILDLQKSDHFNFVTKSLSDAVLRPCQYTLDKRYDESIPVQTFRRSIRENLKLNGDKCGTLLDKKVTLGPRPFTPVRRLENIVSCPMSPLPRLTSYSSSSGSLINNINGLSFESNEFVMKNGLSFTNGICDCLPEMDSLDMVKACRSAEYPDRFKNGFDELTPELSVGNASNSTQLNGDVNHDEEPVTSTAASLSSHRPVTSDSCEVIESTNTTVEDVEARSGASDTGDSNANGPRKSSLKSKHSKRSRRNRATIQQNATQHVSVSNESSKLVTESTKEQGESVGMNQTGPHHETTLNEPVKMNEKMNPHIANGESLPKAESNQFSTSGKPLQPAQEISSTNEVSIEDSIAADGDFTLVTTKKHKRQQKLQQQLQLQQQHKQTWVSSSYQSRNSAPLPSPVPFRPQKPTTSIVRLPVSSVQSQSANKASAPPLFHPPTLPPNDKRRFGNFSRANAPLPNPVRRSVPNLEPHTSALHSSDTLAPSTNSTVSTEPPEFKLPQPLTKPSIRTSHERHPTAHPPSTTIATSPCVNVSSFSSHTTPKFDVSNPRFVGVRPAQYQILRKFLLSSWTAFKSKSTGF